MCSTDGKNTLGSRGIVDSLQLYFNLHFKTLNENHSPLSPTPFITIPLEQLIGMNKQPVKRGPASVLQRQIEQIGLMPRNKQKIISEVLDAMIKQQQAS